MLPRTLPSAFLAFAVLVGAQARAQSRAQDPCAERDEDRRAEILGSSRVFLACRGGPGRDFRHTLQYPTLVATTLTSPYFGIRVGGDLRMARYRPFQTIDGDYKTGTIGGAIDLGFRIGTRIGMYGIIDGSIITGANAGTFVGRGADVGGGGTAGLVWRFYPHASDDTTSRSRLRLAFNARVSERTGQTVVVARGLSAFSTNPTDSTLTEALPFVERAVDEIFVTYNEPAIGADFAWAYVPMHQLSLQGSIGAERRVRYSKSGEPRPTILRVERVTLPKIGLALTIDFSRDPGPGEPSRNDAALALMIEYQLAPVTVGTRMPSGPVGGTERYAEHRFAVGLYYANPFHSDLQLGLSGILGLNLDPDPYHIGTISTSTPFAWSIGGQAMSRYVW